MKKLLLSFMFISFGSMVTSQKLADISMFYPVEEEEQTEIDTVKRFIGDSLKKLKAAQDALKDEYVLNNIKNICVYIFYLSKLLKIDAFTFIESLENLTNGDLSYAKDYIATSNLTDEEKEDYLKDWFDDYIENYLQLLGKDKAINQVKDFYEWLIIKNLTKDFKFAD